MSTSTPAWRKVGPYVKSYLSNLVHLAPLLVDAALIRLVCAHLAKVRHYLVPFARLQNKIARALLDFFSTGEELVRIDAFLMIRTMALHGTQQMVDNLLKQTYLHFVRNAKFYNKNSAPTIHLMANCVVELFSLFPRTAYQFSFVYLRQLAIHLRSAILNKGKEQGWQSVYNWQFMNCMRVFAMLLANMCQGDPAALAAAATVVKTGAKSVTTTAAAAGAASSASAAAESELYPLVYPFIQVCVSVIELMPNVRFYPLRFLCVRLINQVSRATGVYVPLSPHLLPVLHMAQLEKKTKSLIKGKVSPFDFSLHVSKALIVSKAFQDYAFGEALRLLTQHLACYAYSIAFPELAVPVLLQLRKFAKATRVLRFSKQAQALIRQLELQSAWSQRLRGAVDTAPAAVTSVYHFRNAQQYGAAPLELYAKQQVADAAASAASGGDKVKSKRQLQEDGDDSEEEWIVEEPTAKKAKAAAAAPASAAGGKAAKKKGGDGKPAPPPSNEDDEVVDFEEFSDDEDD